MNKYGYEYLVSKKLTEELKGLYVIARNSYGNKSKGKVKRAYIKVFEGGHSCIAVMFEDNQRKLTLDSICGDSSFKLYQLDSILAKETNTYWACRNKGFVCQEVVK